MLFPSYRPEEYTGRGDKYLKEISNELRRIIAKKQNFFSDKNLKLNSQNLRKIATCLTEFGEDIHNEIGIWNSLEFYNIEFFGTPLPLTIDIDKNKEVSGFNKARVQYLLWNLYTELLFGMLIGPNHPDFIQLAEVLSEFLQKRFSSMPKNSGVKMFLESANNQAWDVKKKLVWMGTRSYLFRHHFENYLVKNEKAEPDISTIDDFICQDCTRWSGLGVIDILASTIRISDNERRTLRSWHERHLAWYKLLSADDIQTKALNIINGETYLITNSRNPNPYKEGQLIQASLVPWNSMWYWSGSQRRYEKCDHQLIEDVRKNLFQHCSRIIYRYHKSYLEKAKESLKKQHTEFRDYFGDNFFLFKDGLSMAADLQKLYRKRFDSAPPEQVKRVMKDHGLKNPCPDMPFPEELLDCENGVALYFNKEEGLEIIKDMNSIIIAMKKQGNNLTKDELFLLRGLIRSESVSIQFVSYLIDKFSAESINSTFLLDHDQNSIGLHYLFRSYKGHYYRTRYPTISLPDFYKSDKC